MSTVRILLFCILGIISCTPDKQADNSSNRYFDLKTYFKSEALRLQKENPKVVKTIAKNNLRETRTIVVKSWINELELLSSSDINKPAWETEYEIKNLGNETQYLAKNSKLKTKKIVIEKFPGGKIKHISIINGISNNLYSSTENLDYYPDSLYSILKKQKILVIGNTDYSVVGLFKRK